jgi:acetyltransferase-like isoleucine patch superfamily enzyme
VLIDAGPRFGDVERPVRDQGVTARPIVVGDDVRIGPAAALLAGATVPADAAIPAHAVVGRDVGPEDAPVSPRPAPRRPARPARDGRGPR